MTDVAIVVLNWEGGDDTLDCLRSLRASSVPLHSIVVDNGSRDDSVARIRESGLADTFIETGANLGYAGGNNAGVERALRDGFDVIGVLNNDTLVDPDCAEALLSELPPGLPRAVSADIRYHDEPDRSWFLGGVLNDGFARHLIGAEQRAGTTQLLSGCCLVARREVWGRVGLFDERFFLIFEDFDWSLRAGAKDVELVIVPAAIIFHKVSRSFKSSKAAARTGAFYFARNGTRLAWRWDRRHCLGFIVRQVVRPALRGMRHGAGIDALFPLLGLGAFALGQSGAAPRALVRLAESSPRRKARRPL